MNTIRFVSDFHIGKRLREHTNSISQKLMTQTIYERALKCVDTNSPVVNLGDLFDTYTNDEATIMDGLDIARRCRVTLQGNHDVKNVTGLQSSLDLVREALPEPKSVVIGTGSACFDVRGLAGVNLVMVPHHFTQEAFEQAIRNACGWLNDSRSPAVLCLHCNVSDGFSQDGPDPSGSGLYLTTELQKLVAEHFPLTVVGHEHVPRTEYPSGKNAGRIQLLGNHFPLGFGEIADRYVWDLNVETLALKPVEVFSAKDEFVQLTVASSEDLVELADECVPEEILFVDVVGEIDQEKRPDLGRALLKFWKNNPHLLAVRKNVEITGVRKVTKAKAGESLVDVIRRNAVLAGFEKQFEEIAAELAEGEVE